MQTHKVDRETVPLILVGRDYWTPLNEFIKETVRGKYHAIDEEDMKLYHLVDTAQEAFDIIVKSPPRKELYY